MTVDADTTLAALLASRAAARRQRRQGAVDRPPAFQISRRRRRPAASCVSPRRAARNGRVRRAADRTRRLRPRHRRRAAPVRRRRADAGDRARWKRSSARKPCRAFGPAPLVHANQVRSPLLVRRGERVSVRARAAGVAVRTYAMAQQDGSLGDLVQVQASKARNATPPACRACASWKCLPPARRPATSPRSRRNRDIREIDRHDMTRHATSPHRHRKSAPLAPRAVARQPSRAQDGSLMLRSAAAGAGAAAVARERLVHVPRAAARSPAARAAAARHHHGDRRLPHADAERGRRRDRGRPSRSTPC